MPHRARGAPDPNCLLHAWTERCRYGLRFSRSEKEQQSMSIFGNIMSAIFKSRSPAATAPSAAPPAAPAAETRTDARSDTKTDARANATGTGGPAGSAAPAEAQGSAATATLERVDVAAVLTRLAAQNEERLDWRRSIVDLMKLLNLDSSLAARKQLAQELRYPGDMSDSASMNIWLHRQVMQKLAENGGKVPADLTAR
jgi:hypothetical protein